MDEGVKGFGDQLGKMPLDPAEAQKEVEEETKEVEQKEEVITKIIEDLTARANMAADEKEEVLTKLSDARKELEASKEELKRLQCEFESVQNDEDTLYLYKMANKFNRFYSPTTRRHMLESVAVMKNRIERTLMRKRDFEIEHFLRQKQYLDEEGHLTTSGIDFFRRVMELTNIPKRPVL